MNKNLTFHKPIGYIGSIKHARQKILNHINNDDEILELTQNASKEDMKNFRKFLINRGINRKVGIIFLINRIINENLAVLLKIFEELPSFNACFFTASFLPNYTILTRSEIHFLTEQENNEEIISIQKFLINAMHNNLLTKQMMHGWKIFLQSYSLYLDETITEQEKNNILASLL